MVFCTSTRVRLHSSCSMLWQGTSLTDGTDGGAEAMLMSPSSLRSEQTAGMLTSPCRSMLSSRFEAPPAAHPGDAAAAATPAGGSAAVSAMATPRSMGRGSAGDSMTSSRTLTTAADAAPAGQGSGALPQRRAAVAAQNSERDAVRRQQSQMPQAHPTSQLEPQQKLQLHGMAAKEDVARTTFGSQDADAGLHATKQPLPGPPYEERDEVPVLPDGPHRMCLTFSARCMYSLTNEALVPHAALAAFHAHGGCMVFAEPGVAQ